VATLSFYPRRISHTCAKSYSPFNCINVTPSYKFHVSKGFVVLHRTHDRLQACVKFCGTFSGVLVEWHISKQVSLLIESLQVFGSTAVQHYLSGSTPTFNYDTVTNLGVEVTMQVELVARVTQGEFAIPENLRNIFPYREFVMFQSPILLEIHIFLNTRFPSCGMKQFCSMSRYMCRLTGPSK
jgi:hypothetical protein